MFQIRYLEAARALIEDSIDTDRIPTIPLHVLQSLISKYCTGLREVSTQLELRLSIRLYYSEYFKYLF